MPTAAASRRGIPQGWLGARLQAWHKQSQPQRAAPLGPGMLQAAVPLTQPPTPPAQAGEHVRPPQPTAPVELQAPAEGPCWQLLPGNWAATPSPPNPRSRGFSRACSYIKPYRAPCAPQQEHLCPSATLRYVVGAAQPDGAKVCWVPEGTTTLSPPSPCIWLCEAGRAFWNACLGGAQGWGCSPTHHQMCAFPGREFHIWRRHLGVKI